MPHQCIECGRTFPDGSKEMLTGCPECGGNKFQFRPSDRSETAEDSAPPTSAPPAPATDSPTDAGEPTAPSDSSSTSTHSTAGDPIDAADETTTTDDAATTGDATTTDDATADADVSEDSAQASARTDVVTRDELDRVREDTVGSDDPPDASRRPGVDDLREELTDQFESIKILSPGQYELNLMELYDRQEYIISLREDGRYVIEMPSTWDDPE
ncbi:OapC/ArvC family zinc-ribbon domain-containing protein [Halorubrum sp. SY-15]|uniref:OapC/ArvC family zinc-ribbon domain-containing protein n=1 Tax=Halorubrum sp. SY-15 TaxID=3402277 RepID=UPI003EBE1BFD